VLGGAGAVKASSPQAVKDKPILVDAERARHILEGDPNTKSGGHRYGTGRPGKSEFPRSWSDKKILQEISDVAIDPRSRRTVERGGTIIAEGKRDGAEIRLVIGNENRIVSAYPTNVRRNPR
jgi:hypothetical protein